MNRKIQIQKANRSIYIIYLYNIYIIYLYNNNLFGDPRIG